MLQTIADECWGQPSCAYHVQPRLSPETQERLAGLQLAVAECWPAPLNLMPPRALHITIYAIVPVKASFDKQAYWRQIADPALHLLQDLCAGHGAIDLHFTQLKVTPAAVVALARDESGLIEAIRQRIAGSIPPPPGLKPLHYDFIHSTLIRYPTSMPVPKEAVRRVESLPVAIPARVEAVRLVRETLYPCLSVEELACVSLL